VCYLEETGVPQESSLNVALFAITTNGMANMIGPSALTSSYIDDVAIFSSFRIIAPLKASYSFL
jgi:hypothetical protein